MNTKYNYSILTLVVSLIYASVIQWLPDFPVGEDVFQILIGYLFIKVANSGEVKEAAGKVKSLFITPEPVSKKLKK